MVSAMDMHINVAEPMPEQGKCFIYQLKISGHNRLLQGESNIGNNRI